MCALATLVAAVGLALFYNGIDTTLYALACVALCAGLACAVWVPQTTNVDIGPAGMTLALLFAWALLGLSWSAAPYLTSIHAGITGAALAGYLSSRMIARSPSARRMLRAALACLGVVFALAMLVQLALGRKPEGSFLNVNSAGAFLNWLWPLAAATALVVRDQRDRVAWLMAVGIMVFAVGMTGGRAVALALLAALGAVVFGCRVWANRRRLAGLATVVLGALLAAQAVSQALPQSGGRNLGDRMVTLADPDTAGESRLRIWEGTWAMIQERPWLGWGPGTFFQAYPAHRSPADGSAGQHVHNDFLQYWVESGFPALLLLVALFGICAYLFVGAARRPPNDDADRVMYLAGGAAVAGAGVHGLFSYNLQLLPMLLLLGLAVGALEAGSGARPWVRIPLERIRTRRLPAVAFLGLLAIPVVHLGTVAASAHYTNVGASALAEGDYDRADAAFATAARLWPSQDLAYGMRADLYRRGLASMPDSDVDRRRAVKQRGLDLVDQAAARNPLRPLHQLTRGRLLQQPPDADHAAAEHAFRHALELNPRAAEARVALARLLLEQGRDAEALRVVNDGFGPVYSQHDPRDLMRLGVHLRAQAGDDAGAERLRAQLRVAQSTAASAPAGAAEVLPLAE